MALDKSKLATLVKAQNKMPPMPEKLKKSVANSPAAPAKAEVKMSEENEMPTEFVPFEDMTPQEKADLIETAAQAAENQLDEGLEDLLVDYMDGDMMAVPEWVKDPELWEKSVEAVGLGTPDEEKYDEPYAVVAYLYSMLGGMTTADDMMDEEMREDEGEGEEGGEESEAATTTENEMPEEELNLKSMTDEAAEEAKNNPDEKIESMLADYNPEVEGNPPQWVADEDKWEKAKAAVEPNWDSYDEPYAVVAYVYKNMGGGFK